MRIRTQILPFSIPLFLLVLFWLLFAFRLLDDNTLTRWLWVFDHVDVKRFSLFLVLGMLLAYPASRCTLPKGCTGPALFCLASVVALPFWREPELILDSARYFSYAKHVELLGPLAFLREWGHGIDPWTDLPLIPFLYGLIFKLLGESRTAIQSFTTLLFSSTVFLTYRLGRLLWDEGLGIRAGILLLGFPYLMTQVPLMLVDVPTMFFLALSLYTFIQALLRGGASWLTSAALALFLSLLTKYSAWMMLSVLLPASLLGLKEAPMATVRRCAVLALSVGLLSGALFLLKYPAFLKQLRLLIDYQLPGLQRWSETFVSTFLFQIHPLVTASAAGSVALAITKRDWRFPIISWLPLLVLVMQVARIRYLIPVFPMFALMASYGLQGLRREELKNLLVSCIAIASIVIGLFAYLPFLGTISAANLRDAGKLLDDLEISTVEVFTLASSATDYNPSISLPLLDLFTKKQIVHRAETSLPPPREEIEVSSLRFTWEYRIPVFYRPEVTPSKSRAIVVIADEPWQRLPASIESGTSASLRRKVFDKRTGIFDYRSIVTVYYKPGLGS